MLLVLLFSMYTTLPPYCGIDFAIVFNAHEEVAKIQLEIDAQCRHPKFIPLVYKIIKVLALECIFLSPHVYASTEGEHPHRFSDRCQYSLIQASRPHLHQFGKRK